MCKALSMGSGAEKTRTDLSCCYVDCLTMSHTLTVISRPLALPGRVGPHALHSHPLAPAGFPSQAAWGLAGSSAPALAVFQDSCSAPSPICQPVVCPP